MPSVVIVESPAKCKTINKYLGKDYTVLASFGHIRDLPSKDGSVEPNDDFAMHYQISSDSTKHVKAITDAMKRSDKLILATDPDREGEAISWHVLEVLKAKKVVKKDTPVERVAFSSITKKAVSEALEQPRTLDMDLINAQQARRALDYLVGFNLSPVLWRKLPGSRSAGRVQSVALRIICEREEEIEQFDSREYWTLDAVFETGEKAKIQSQLTHYQGEKLDKFAITTEAEAKKIESALSSASYHIASIETKESQRKPYAPFTTSTLQQEASRKLGFSAKRTMQTAQKLYEGIQLDGETTGLITYMRTDGVDVAPEAMYAARELVESRYGQKYLPEKPRYYSKKQKNAQEAHEAIRPTDPKRTPDQVKGFLNDDQHKLYDLIWKRLIASQMTNVILDQVALEIAADKEQARFRATGSTVRFDGFYKVYREGRDDDGGEDDEKKLPPVSEGDALALATLEKDEKNPEGLNPLAVQHFTQPPPRYTEASLVKKLEELGIGRPSTYASIISVLQDRDYVKLEQKRFFPEMRGRLVTKFLERYFPRYVEYDFTAKLEEDLDDIASGELDWKQALRQFWGDFSGNVEQAMQLEFSQVLDDLNESLAPVLFPGDGPLEERRKCPACGTGQLGLKTGKFGAFLGCSNYPECGHTVQLPGSGVEGAVDEAASGSDLANEPKLLGQDPETGKDITLRKGPYGFYVQLGEPEGKAKPKRASLPKGQSPETATLEQAIKLLSLPRVVGMHPESGKEIVANIGRYGPYVQHDGKFTSLKGDDDPYTIGINRAVTVIAEGAQKGGRKGAEPIKELGNHPKDGKPVAVYDGRYGPYVKHVKTNASLPKGTEPESLTLEGAVKLLEEAKVRKKKKAS